RVDRRPGRTGSRSIRTRVSFQAFDSLIALVRSEQGIEGPARVGEDRARLGDLLGAADVADLAGGHPQPAHLLKQRRDRVVDRPAHLLPGRTQLGAARLDLGAPRVRQHVDTTVADLFGPDEAFVLELRERRVDRAWARPPDAVRALLDLLHDLVAVERAFCEEEQRRGTDLAPPGPRPTREPTPATEWPKASPATERGPVPAATSSRHRHDRACHHGAAAPVRTPHTEARPLEDARLHA